MDTLMAVEILGGSCGIIMLIVFLKKKAQLVLNFLVRVVLGVICMMFVNDFLKNQGIMVSVGINPISLLTAGSLGIPGVVLLYGIVASKFL